MSLLPSLRTVLATAFTFSVAVAASPFTASTPASAAIADDAAQQLTHSFSVPSKYSSSQTLSTLRVATDTTMSGYSRDLFPHWRDASTWGWPVAPSDACNARRAALYRDGVGVTVTSTCSITGGKWLDPYTAQWFYDQYDIQIDHVVPLAEAWRTGAASWTTTRRTQFANDPLVVMSVDGYANNAKGDKGPEAWKPANTKAHCLYAKRYIAIKAKYTLTVSSAEKSALTSMLGTCAS